VLKNSYSSNILGNDVIFSRLGEARGTTKREFTPEPNTPDETEHLRSKAEECRLGGFINVQFISLITYLKIKNVTKI
jgi:hypothetical protein